MRDQSLIEPGTVWVLGPDPSLTPACACNCRNSALPIAGSSGRMKGNVLSSIPRHA